MAIIDYDWNSVPEERALGEKRGELEPRNQWAGTQQKDIENLYLKVVERSARQAGEN